MQRINSRTRRTILRACLSPTEGKRPKMSGSNPLVVRTHEAWLRSRSQTRVPIACVISLSQKGFKLQPASFYAVNFVEFRKMGGVWWT